MRQLLTELSRISAVQGTEETHEMEAVKILKMRLILQVVTKSIAKLWGKQQTTHSSRLCTNLKHNNQRSQACLSY